MNNNDRVVKSEDIGHPLYVFNWDTLQVPINNEITVTSA